MTCEDRIQAIRQSMGTSLLILGHHYQPDAMMPFVDFSGDSLELSHKAAQSKATHIVFCGVRFMAETADILVRDDQGLSCGRLVYLPAPEAGCPMADMATDEALEEAWAHLTRADPEARYVPVVYVNSSAEVKAFCGRHGGSACTSGNGQRVITHFLNQGYKILFAPDQFLSSNIMHDLGYPDDAVALYDATLSDEEIRHATLITWPGYCPIHYAYTIHDVETMQAAYPDAEMMVHPESTQAVTRASDRHGSTKDIIAWVDSADPTKTCIVGTEQKLVDRLIQRYPDRHIVPLKSIVCPDMNMTTPERLLQVLETWPKSCLVHVDDALTVDARACVDRMLTL